MSLLQVTALVGEPCVGKSRIMSEFMSTRDWTFERYGDSPAVPCHVHRRETDDLIVLGDYREATAQFPGTDRMSMAIQPSVQAFLPKCHGSVLWEGDRLSNGKLFDWLCAHPSIDFVPVFIYVEPSLLAGRRKAERQAQSETFVKGRRTKFENLLAKFGEQGRHFWNNEPRDVEKIIRFMEARV